LGQEIVELIMNPTDSRQRLCEHIYLDVNPDNPLGLLQEALELAISVKAIERKVFDAKRAGQISADDTPGQIQAAEKAGILTQEEASQLREFDAKVLALIGVDDFAPQDLARQRPTAKKAPAKKRAVRKKAKKVATAAKAKAAKP
jgi:acyl-CoA dehydrogenase